MPRFMAGPGPTDPTTPPTSSDPVGPCPRCGVNSSFEVVDIADVTFKTDGGYLMGPGGHYERIAVEQVSVMECRACRQRVVVVEEKAIGGVPSRLGGKSGTVTWQGVHWWPPPAAAMLAASVPEAIRDAYAEGLRCLAVNAYNAAGVMFRRALEAIIESRGSDTAKSILKERGPAKIARAVNQMAADGALTRDLADWADDVRDVGNAGGHWDPGQDLTKEDAEALSGLIQGLFDYLWILPAKMSARRRGSSTTS